MPNTKTELTYHFIGSETYEPEDGDYMIQGKPSGPDELSQVKGNYHGTFPSVHKMCWFIRNRMEEENFWSNVWYVNERGTIDLCEIAPANV